MCRCYITRESNFTSRRREETTTTNHYLARFAQISWLIDTAYLPASPFTALMMKMKGGKKEAFSHFLLYQG